MNLIRQKTWFPMSIKTKKTSGISCNHLCQTCVFKSIRIRLFAFLKCGMANFKEAMF